MAFTGASFKSFTRVAGMALALAASSLVAAPAFAQGGSSGFSIEMHGNGGGQGFGNAQRPNRDNGWDDNWRQRCLSNREVARGISAYGYERVDITRERRDRVELQAIKGNWLYAMRVDKCSGEVDRVERIGRAFGRDNYGRDNHGGGRGGDNRGGNGMDDGGFGFQFNFGN